MVVQERVSLSRSVWLYRKAVSSDHVYTLYSSARDNTVEDDGATVSQNLTGVGGGGPHASTKAACDGGGEAPCFLG